MTVIATAENFDQLRAAYGDEYLILYGCAREVPCEVCGSEGRIYRGLYDDERDCGECPECKGTGGMLVRLEPVECDDGQTA